MGSVSKILGCCLFVLTTSLPIATPDAVAQSLVPPGVYGYGWGEFPYWLKPTYDYSYEAMTVRPPVVCGYRPTPVYSVKRPTKSSAIANLTAVALLRADKHDGACRHRAGAGRKCGRRRTMMEIATTFARSARVSLAFIVAGIVSVQAAELSQRAPANPLAGIKLDALAATRDQPLFAPNRRPPQKASAVVYSPPPPPQVNPPALSLLGIVSNPNDAHAIVHVAGADRPRTLRIGDAIDGWHVISIDPQRLVIGYSDRVENISMFKPSPGMKLAIRLVNMRRPPGATIR